MKTQNRVVSWESHLVQRAQVGETVAFELLADLYRPALLNLALRMLRNADDAKDAVQETFIKAYRALKDFDPARPIKPWLSRICANCCVDIVRDHRRATDPIDQHEYMIEDPGDSPEERAGEALEGDEVRAAVSRLPEKYRRIVFMRHFRHMDVNEIAKALNKPEGTIKSWLFRARALLKKDLQLALSR